MKDRAQLPEESLFGKSPPSVLVPVVDPLLHRALVRRSWCLTVSPSSSTSESGDACG